MTIPDSITPTKKCTGPCGRELPATREFFYADKRGKYGLRAICRKCTSILSAAHYQETREDQRAHSSAYNAAHRTEHREYYLNHKEEISAKKAVYRANHREEIAAKKAAYNASHPEKQRARNAKYKSSPKYKIVNRGYKHRRRALEQQSGGRVTATEYRAVLAAHTNAKGQIICAWCGKQIEGDWHYDHWIPLDKGGRHEAGNLRVMHGNTSEKCNLHKGAKLPSEFGKLI